jgi:hypothetical protein
MQIEEAFAQHYEELFSTRHGREFSIDFGSIGIPRHNQEHLDG